MKLQSRIEVLKKRHAELDMRITQEDRRPCPNEIQISRLKIEKLRLKEQMERLKASPSPV